MRSLWSVLSFTLLLALGAVTLLMLAPQNVRANYAWEVVASQLDNPRQLTFGADGTLYVAEAGAGGPTCVTPDPTNPDVQICIGQSGAISKVAPDGTQSRVVSDLWSAARLFGPGEPPEIVGPQGIVAMDDGTLYTTVGFGGNPADREPLFGADGLNFGQLVAVEQNVGWQNVIDIAEFEGANNPDGGGIDSNPYALEKESGSALLATDAGGNDLLRLTLPTPTESGSLIELLSVFPSREVPPPFPPPPPTVPMESVPTTIYYDGGPPLVGELTGFPFIVGAARIYEAPTGVAPTVLLDGFTNITDMDKDADGNLYVLEIATNSLLSGDITGAIHKVEPDGTRTIIANAPCNAAAPTGMELCAPTGLVVGPDGALYVANYGVFGAAPPPAPSGQVVRIDLGTPTAVTLDGFNGRTAPSGGMFIAIALLAAACIVAARRRGATASATVQPQ